VDQLAEYSWLNFGYSPLIISGSAGRARWSHFGYFLLITRGSAGRGQLVTLRLLSTHHPWISWQSTAGHTSVTLHSSPVDQQEKHSWSHFCHTPLITRVSAGRSQLVTLLLLSTHHPWISWQSTAGHTSVTLQSHPCVSWQSTLVTLRLLSTQHLCVSWQSTAGHTSVTLHSSSVGQLSEHSLSQFGNSSLITRGPAGKVQLVKLRLLSTHHPWVSWQSTAGHTSVTLHSPPVDQLAEHIWSHLDYTPLITRGSVGRAELVTLLLLSNPHPWISWQSTAGHTSVNLQSSPADQLADHSWSHFCYSLLITRGSAGRVQLVTLLLLSTHHPWISRKSTAGHTSATLHLSPVDQLAEHSWSYFCYSPVITRVSAGRANWSHFGYSPLNTCVSAGRVQLVTLLLLSTHHPWVSCQSTAGHTSVTLHSLPADQLAKYSWSHFDYSPLIICGSAGRVQLVTLRLLFTHHPWISWQSTSGHT
jgi:hypothetical protein